MAREKLRIDDSRRLEERIAQLNQTMDMKPRDTINSVTPPDGWEYYWALHKFLGDDSKSRVSEMMRSGWTPVPKDRHPEIHYNNFLNKEDTGGSHVEERGLILFEKPKAIVEKERRRRDEAHMERIMSLRGTDNFMSDPDPQNPSSTVRFSYGIRDRK